MAKREEFTCLVCDEACEEISACELCGGSYGPCCNSMRNNICTGCSDGGWDDA